MSIATVGNQLIHYEVVGHGQPLIFIHGWIGSWRYWWPTMQSMAVRHRTYAFDLWGFGDSSKHKEFYSLESYVNMLDSFMESIAIRRPVTLVGHALGAAVALRFASRNPGDVKCIAAVTPPISGGGMHERLLTGDPSSIVSRVPGLSFPEVDREVRKTDVNAFSQLAREINQIDFTAEIQACETPLMLVFGEQDQIIKPPSNGLPDPNANLTYISLACNHFPMLEDSMKFNRLMMELIHAEGDLQKISPKDHWVRRNR